MKPTMNKYPSQAVDICKRHFLDCTGAALAAVNEPIGRIIHDYVSDLNVPGGSRIIGSGLQTSIDNSALANGILAHAVSFDDSGPSHPSVTVVPPLYAMADYCHLSGRDVLTAQVIGYEIFQRLNMVTQKARQIRDRGWHPTGFFGAIVSTLISSKIFGLDLNQSLNAVGIAASMGGGLSQNIGNMTMPMHAGNASRNGVTATLLARKGFTGDHEVIEGRFGLMNALAGEGNYQIKHLLDNIGSNYCVIDPGINIKFYPHCWGHHKLFDAMLYLVEAHDLIPKEIVFIECDLQPEKSTSRYLKPETEFEAKYSIGYGLARCLLDRKLDLEQYKPEKIKDPAWHEVVSKIVHVPRGTLDAEDKFRVTLKTKSGKTFSKKIDYPKGHAKFNPLTDKELQEKFIKCARLTLPDVKVEQSLELISNMDRLDDVKLIIDSVTS